MHKGNTKKHTLFLFVFFIIFIHCPLDSRIDEPKWNIVWETKFNDELKGGDFLHVLINNKSNNVFCTSNGNFIAILDLITGNTKWEKLYKSSEHSGFCEPICNDKYLYFGNYNGNYYSINFSTYEKLFEITSDFKGTSKICCNPQSGAIKDTTIVIGGARNYTGRIQGIHAYSGEVLWDKSFPKCPIKGKSASDSNKVYFNAGDSLIAIDYNGNIVWKHFIEEKGVHRRSFPVLFNQTIYVSTSYHILAVDKNTGTEIWKIDFISRSLSSPLVTDSRVYIYNEENIFFCLDSKTGKTLWKTKLPKGYFSETQPVRINDYIAFIFSPDTEEINIYIYWLDKSTGKIKYRKKLPKNEVFNGRLIVNNKILYLQSRKQYKDNKKYSYSILRAVKVF